MIQRVKRAKVTVGESVTGSIGPGLVVFVGIRESDALADVEKLAKKAVHLRVFADASGKTNLSLLDVGGSLLIVSQFTLYAETSKGNRPSYSLAARPEKAKELYDSFVTKCRSMGVIVETGVFQAEMVVEILNDGPVTISCQSEA